MRHGDSFLDLRFGALIDCSTNLFGLITHRTFMSQRDGRTFNRRVQLQPDWNVTIFGRLRFKGASILGLAFGCRLVS